ncbi:cob(I)yrinic acid a,c-diamide adenosyltransferase [Aeromicrobium phragmitis]|uniref:Cob(I)yrinic acid a,c-diamide adenosyltransferase n=1 Tax=Aeromicrobium phragmitis TaxID=2478914 RepID=A0A3L8PKT9_9ACTN|nr:cob(I)yrinic acid a,c-diamide adenosyltransferase [Aeromicrobium phragmitis]RLV54672.1 cob(I)yrinic acid a,c-diamide adenosyltransferase [Aeromicrobium phragmitis]
MTTGRRRRQPTDGIVMLFVGDGWGKSAASFGYAMRSAGRGWATLVVQFLKGEPWNAAEAASARRLGVEWAVFTPATSWGAAQPQALGAMAWERSRVAIESGEYGLVILDELTHAVHAGWVDEREVVETLERRAASTSVIVTGRTASGPLVSAADTVTRFSAEKHREKRGILQ